MNTHENDYFSGSFATSSPRYSTTSSPGSSALPRYNEIERPPMLSNVHRNGTSAIWLIVSILLAVASLISFGIVVLFARQFYRKKPVNNRGKDAIEDQTDSSTFTSSTAGDHVETALIVTEWTPPKRRHICRGRPIEHEVDAAVMESSTILRDDSKRPDCVTKLFEDSRGFGTFVHECHDDNTPSIGFPEEDEDDDDAFGHTVDLVRAGVFKRTLDILKEQPRCVLCSVCYEVGDKISVSNSPSCSHQYHQLCILRWLKEKSSLCPVCREPYIEHHNDRGNNGAGGEGHFESNILL